MPSWDGNPTTYRAYKDSVRIWLLGEKADVEYSLAARLVQNLSGAARTLGNNMTDKELMPDTPPQEDHGTEVVETAAEKHERLLSGVRRLLSWTNFDLKDLFGKGLRCLSSFTVLVGGADLQRRFTNTWLALIWE